MGLFDGVGKREMAENVVLQSMARQPILDDIVGAVMSEDAPWITTCQGFYDTRKRQITVGADLFRIAWSGYNGYSNEEGFGNEVIRDVIEYSFTGSGYVPLHSHMNEKGREDVSAGRVIYLCTALIQERLRAKLPNCKFGEVIEYEDHSTFVFAVPPIQWKNWF